MLRGVQKPSAACLCIGVYNSCVVCAARGWQQHASEQGTGAAGMGRGAGEGLRGLLALVELLLAVPIGLYCS